MGLPEEKNPALSTEGLAFSQWKGNFSTFLTIALPSTRRFIPQTWWPNNARGLTVFDILDKKWSQTTPTHDSRSSTSTHNATPQYFRNYGMIAEEEMVVDEEEDTSSWAGEPDGGYDINEGAFHGHFVEADLATAFTLYNHFLSDDTVQDYLWTSRRPFEFLKRSKIPKETRALLVNWMMEVQEYAGFPTHFLFMAVELLDYYTANSVIPLYEYQLVACAAQDIVLDLKPQFAIPGEVFVKVTGSAYTLEQLRNMEAQVERVVGVYWYTPNPYNYLSACFRFFERLNSPLSRAECFLMCRYILEHRFIARNPNHRDEIILAFPFWSPDLAGFTGVEENHHLKIVAYYYGRQLIANRMHARGEYMEATSGFLTAFRKYLRPYYRQIASHSALLSFTLHSVFPEDEVQALFSFPLP
ncbi:G2/mitotic-specific cyclin-B1 [Taenia crassiceps]|uniref:G2/mitotic-specific cyclin-B1 n=1 Tax=Taenia crassiceps TaxID=6207 RepID=A0ABR4Q3R7_9CEST